MHTHPLLLLHTDTWAADVVVVVVVVVIAVDNDDDDDDTLPFPSWALVFTHVFAIVYRLTIMRMTACVTDFYHHATWAATRRLQRIYLPFQRVEVVMQGAYGGWR